MIFQDREDAGRQLAKTLGAFANRKDVVVLGIPRGGVVVAAEVAAALGARLDIFVSRKLGVPGHEELAFGAIATGGTRVLDEETIRALKISRTEIEQITTRARKELSRREQVYRGGRPAPTIGGTTILLVDDGIATGSSILAAIESLRQLNPARIVVAVPVAPASTCSRLKPLVEDLVCVYAPDEFYAIGEFYEDFSQVTDDEVSRILRAADERLQAVASVDPPPGLSTAPVAASAPSPRNDAKRNVLLDVNGAELEGSLVIPDHAAGLVIFAHGSGSSRHSPRNRYVAQMLNSRGFATLLFDLLTDTEELEDRYTGKLRFDIPFLADRLVGVTKRMATSTETQGFRIGYFGASTGAAAALVAAAKLPDSIAAVVSRGGRPDLAADDLDSVRAATLLIVGGEDEPVLGMNRSALRRLHSPQKQMAIVPGATHLFEEPGALEQVARLAADWFGQHLKASDRAAAGRAR